MSRIYLDIITAVNILILAIPVIILFSNLKRQSWSFKWLAFLLAFTLAIEVTGPTFFLLGLNPNIVANASYLFSIPLFCIFSAQVMEWKRIRPWLVVTFLYVGFTCFNLFFIQKISINSYTDVLQSLIILLLCLAYFYKLLKELPTQQLQTLPLFWIMSAFFFTNAGKLAIYAVTDYMIHVEKDNLILVWSVHNFLSLVGYIMIGYGAWLNHKEFKSMPSL